MRRMAVLALVIGLVMVVAPSAWAQRPGGGQGRMGGSGLGLLSQKSVQDELKLSADQVASVTKLAEKQRDAGGGSRDQSREERRKAYEERRKAADAAIAEILNADQQKRFKQVSLQLRGVRALADAKVADELKVTDEQKEKIKTLQADLDKQFRDALDSRGDGNVFRKKMEEIRKTGGEKLLAIFTDEQKTKWKEMTGEPFKGEIRSGFGPGGGRGRGGRGGQTAPAPAKEA